MNTFPVTDSLLVIDIGNTRTGLAIWDGDGLHDAHRVSTHEPGAWSTAFERTWSAMKGDRRAVVIGSVHSDGAIRMQAMVEQTVDVNVLRVRDDLPLPMVLEIDNADEVGVDRVCAAAAAYERLKSACAVASFGTAITIDCVSSEGHFLGGTILPGLQCSCDALHDDTANLPRVQACQPQHVIGRNTHDAIVNGVVLGAAGALREIVERFADELREWPQLIITGGNAPLIAELADFVDAVVPDLCLMGIALAYRKAAGEL